MEHPVYLLAPPLSLATDIPNNAIMRGLSSQERAVDRTKAISQFIALVEVLSRDGLVYCLPSPIPLQDQPYTSNVAAVLPHRPNTAILANFASEPRRGEEKVAGPFLQALGFGVVCPPVFFEGEADLKFLGGKTYASAFGMRTSRKFADWLTDTYDADVIRIEIIDPCCYHLDCVMLPLPADRLAVCGELLDYTVMDRLASEYDILDVPLKHAHAGALNCVVSGKSLLIDSTLSSLAKNDPVWVQESAMVAQVGRIADFAGLEPVTLNMSEFNKSGAALSCLVMNLNRRNFER
ncbi:MAG TPA: arginine deiminase-related protein [Streptosporangiaceae bacterium]